MRDGKRIVITYGTYDLLHFGHTRLMERAKALGDYLIVGVTSDAFDRERGKINVFQPLSDRMNAVMESGIPDQVIVEEFQGQKISDIVKYGVDVFAIGSDWEGKFDYLKKYCEVIYLPRTVGVSSTELRSSKSHVVGMGFLGGTRNVERMIKESMHVANAKPSKMILFEDYADPIIGARYDLSVADWEEGCLEGIEALYLSVDIDRRPEIIRQALRAGCHVLCEGAVGFDLREAIDLYDLAESKSLILMEANKTLYFPAFDRLRLLIESGVVGEVKDIRVSNSHVGSGVDFSNIYRSGFYDLAPYVTLPAFVLMGSDYRDVQIRCQFDGDFCTWAKIDLLYENGAATLQAGQGVKTENDLVVTGTQGYIYVPSPWWKTEYFEIRREDLRDTRKYFYEYAGEGMRYEVFEFTRRISEGDLGRKPVRPKEDSLAVVGLLERFHNGEYTRFGSSKFSFGGGERVTDR